jgi:Protein of unknown function (DUF2934)
MNLAVADLQRQTEERRARLLADGEIRERIAFRAYEIYQRRGSGHGAALDDWLQAENDIVSSLVEQELQAAARSTGGKGVKSDRDEAPEPPVKQGKKSRPRAASAGSDTTSNRKAKIKKAEPTGSKSLEKKMDTKPTTEAIR